eukprot:631659_1
MLPIVFSILNLVCGILLVLGGFNEDFCSWFRILFGVCIAWVALTSWMCEQWALLWFPLWNQSFGFMGSAFIFLACRGYYWLLHDGRSWNGFSYFFIWAVGIAYCVISVLQMCSMASCPLPVPLLNCSDGGGSGGSKNDNAETA